MIRSMPPRPVPNGNHTGTFTGNMTVAVSLQKVAKNGLKTG